MPLVPANEDEVIGQGDAGNAQIRIVKPAPGSLQLHPDMAVLVRCDLVERDHWKGRQQRFDTTIQIRQAPQSSSIDQLTDRDG